MSLSAGSANFLKLTNTQNKPLAEKMAAIGKAWENEGAKIFQAAVNPPKEECSEGAALKKLNEIGFHAYYQWKGELHEIKTNMWRPGKHLEKGPKLYEGIEKGYYKLERIEDKSKPATASNIWDSADLSYDEIMAKIQDVETKHDALVTQKAQVEAKPEVKPAPTAEPKAEAKPEIGGGLFAKEVPSFTKASEDSSKKQRNAFQLFS